MEADWRSEGRVGGRQYGRSNGRVKGIGLAWVGMGLMSGAVWEPAVGGIMIGRVVNHRLWWPANDAVWLWFCLFGGMTQMWAGLGRGAAVNNNKMGLRDPLAEQRRFFSSLEK